MAMLLSRSGWGEFSAFRKKMVFISLRNFQFFVEMVFGHLKQDDAFNRMRWSVLSIDKLVTWQHSSSEEIGGHVVLKTSSCLRLIASLANAHSSCE